MVDFAKIFADATANVPESEWKMLTDPRDELIEKLVEALEYSYNFNSPQENGNTVPFDKFAKMEDISKWDFYGLGTAHKVAKALALAKAHGYGGGK